VPDREAPTRATRYTYLDQCDTRSHERSGSKDEPGIVFDPVAIRRVQRIGNDLCEAAGEVQEDMPEPGGRPGSGEGRTGERK